MNNSLAVHLLVLVLPVRVIAGHFADVVQGGRQPALGGRHCRRGWRRRLALGARPGGAGRDSAHAPLHRLVGGDHRAVGDGAVLREAGTSRFSQGQCQVQD